MSDIEKNTEILNNLKKYLNLLILRGQHKIFYNDLGWDEKTIDCINAIEIILAEREEDKKKIKKLEEENKKNVERYEERDNEVWERVKQCKNMQTEIDGLYLDKEELKQAYLHEKLAKEEVEELLENSISTQKVKDKIEEAEKEYNKIHTQHFRDCGIQEERAKAKKEVLEELLGDK